MTPAEQRTAHQAGREIGGEDVVFVGIGEPSAAAVLAKRTHAPEATLVYESGVYGACPAAPPTSTGSPEVVDGALRISDMLSVFGDLQAGRFDLALLSAAQVDVRGNLNSSLLTPTGRAPRHLVGSGGAHDISSLVARLVVVVAHDSRRVVDRVDFVTSPRRHGPGRHTLLVTPEARLEATDDGLVLVGVRAGRDPEAVIAELGLTTPVTVPSDPEQLVDPDEHSVAVLREFVGSGRG